MWAVTADGTAQPTASPAPSWHGLVDTRALVATGQREIVLLKAPSLAQRLARVHYATEAQERAWTSQAFAAQRQVLTTLALDGIAVQPDFSYARVVNGFAAALDPRAVALLEKSPEVAGIYPVRAAFPASLSEQVLSARQFAAGSGRRPEAELPGFDGTGVTVALLDTGVDAAQPYLHGRVQGGIDLLDPAASGAAARPDPQDPDLVEQHGTELAGLVVGSGGPDGLHGVAPAATILPIRIAGWQLAAGGQDAVYARTDQLIAGLERAVDPNGDGDAHDAVRIALVGVAEPYAAFADSPEARAVQGALDLNTLVVAPAGNDGLAGPAFGSLAGPAAAPAALAVAATDARTTLPTARLVLRRGLDVILDRKLALLGPIAPKHSLTLDVATPRSTRGLAGAAPADFFDAHGFSLVAGCAVVAPVGADPQTTAEDAARAGASLLVLYGRALPADALHVSDDLTIPVVAIAAAPALELLAAQRAGIDVGVAIGRAGQPANAERGQVAPFSSRGLAFDGRLKPDLAAPGIGLATSEPGLSADGTARYGTIDGTSGAAATVAGAAALVAQMRPALGASDLKSLLVGNASPAGTATATGAGTLAVGVSAVGEIAASPATLSFGTWSGARWRSTQTVALHNVSTRPLSLSVSARSGGDSEALHFSVRPDRLVLGEGRQATVAVTVSAPARLPVSVVTGSVVVAPAGGTTLRVPFAIGFRRASDDLLAKVTLDRTAFAPSDTSPAILTVQAGNLAAGHAVQIEPVARLDVLLYDADGRFRGVLARQRDLLPGSYSFGITGRGANSRPLAPGRYELRLVAWPTLTSSARPSRAQVSFRIE